MAHGISSRSPYVMMVMSELMTLLLSLDNTASLIVLFRPQINNEMGSTFLFLFICLGCRKCNINYLITNINIKLDSLLTISLISFT